MIEEEVRYFLKKFESYSTRFYTFTPFRLTFYLKAPMCLTHPWMHLDSLILHFYMKRVLGQDYFLLPSKFPIGRLMRDRKDLAITPLKKTKENLYHASVSFFNKDEKRSETLYKRFEDRWIPKTRRKKITRGSGYYKDFAMRMVYILADEVVFYGNGDIEEIGDICTEITALGNDTRVGWGAVRDFKIEPVKEDWSIVAEGKAMRPIPVRFLKKYTEAVYLAWKSPYWASESVDLCAVPGSEVELGEDLERDIFGS